MGSCKLSGYSVLIVIMFLLNTDCVYYREACRVYTTPQSSRLCLQYLLTKGLLSFPLSQVSEWISQSVNELVSDWVSELVNELVNVSVSDWVSDERVNVSELVSVWLSVSGWVGELVCCATLLWFACSIL